jgi:dienelactone hydrolase
MNWCAYLSGLILAFSVGAVARGQAEPRLQVQELPSGIRFGVLGPKGSAPAATLFIFAGSLEDSLTNNDFRKVGLLLSKQGFVCVSLDVPCHGKDQQPKEPAGLVGWRSRLEKGDDLVPGFCKKVSGVLDHLIKDGYTDPQKVSACGTSRGGFIALHWAAAEPRVKCVAAFAPVTDLLDVTEFKGLDQHAAIKSLSLVRHADKLAGRAIWLCIGNNDQRVNTDRAIEFTRRVVAASVARKKPANIELHVLPTMGHSIHATAHDEAAAWFLARIKDAP